MFKRILSVLLLAFIASGAVAQKSPLENSPNSDFDIDGTVKALLDELNRVRIENNVDSVIYNDVLAKASAIQAEYIAKVGKAGLENSSGKYKTTAKRVEKSGGTKKAEEIVLGIGVTKDKKTNLTPKEVAAAAVAKWLSGKTEPGIIKDGNFVFASPSIHLDETGKKAFISIVFGSFNSFNPGVKKRKELKVRFTKKNKKVKTPDAKSCKNCDKFKDYDGLLDGLYVEDRKIYLKYDDLKSLSKLISKPGDGIAVDIIQRAQYDKPDYNIMNNNLLSKGVLTKTVSKEKLLSKNRAQPEEGKKAKKMNNIDSQIGKLPKKLSNDAVYEMNLLIIQGGKLCRTLVKTYTEQGEQDATTSLKLMLMPDSNAYFKPPFSPKADDAILNFTLPFEKNKFEYKESDIDPFLNALQEPDFIINGLYITAYSSIEGDAASNVKLQKKRSESIIQALSKLQKAGVVTTIKTDDSWELFKTSMAGTEYDTLTKMSKEAAIKEINTKPGLSAELEPYLSKQRYAEIVMDITYDIKGPKEEKFSVTKFNQAAKKKDVPLALKIQYFIGKQMREKKYTAGALDKLEIPSKDPRFSGLLNNQVVLKSMANNNKLDEEEYQKLKDIAALDPSNNVVLFNTIYGAIKLDSTVGDSKAISAMQNKINGLYKSEVPKKMVDALNIEWQFKVIDEKNGEEGAEPIIQACTDKVKSFYDLKAASWQNNLKLAYVFARFKDYKYAASLLADFVRQEKVNDQLLFAYISFCAHVPELSKSRTFVAALKKAEKMDHQRYCQLFGAPKLTFQVFDNPYVKEDYNTFKCN